MNLKNPKDFHSMPKLKMHDDEIDIDAALVKRLLDQQFPRWANLSIRPIESAGTDNAIFRLGSFMCVRMPRIENAAKNIEKEHEWLPKLAMNLSLPIPVPLERGEPNDIYPWHWSVGRWLEGDNAAIEPIVDLEHAAIELAQFLIALKKINPVGGPLSYRAGPLITQNSEARAAIRSLQGVIDTEVITAIWDECLKAPVWNKPPVWTHGDLLPTNLLVQKGQLSAIIDFDLMGVGDPACDLIVAWSTLSRDSRKLFRSVLAADDAMWMRGRGWALSIALIIIPYYQITNPGLTAIAHRIINEILTDVC